MRQPRQRQLSEIVGLEMCTSVSTYYTATFDKLVSSFGWSRSTHLLPFFTDALYFFPPGGSGIFRTLLTIQDPCYHLGNYGAVENLHVGRSRNSRDPEVRCPMQCILKFRIFVWRIRARIFRNADHEVRKRFGINREVAAFRPLVAGVRAVDQVAGEFLG